MKKNIVLLLLLVFASNLYAQDSTPTDTGVAQTAGKSATLGVEASTAFVWDAEDNSTGLETRAGMELIFPLFPAADRGSMPESTDEPAARLLLKDASFTWWNTYKTSGGNYEQDNFNSWTAEPLILTFDTFLADVVWKNYFFRVASSTTVMRANQASLVSIFDEVMDAGDRFYYKQNKALWKTDRYNIEQFPLLKNRLIRDSVDIDYRGNVSGSLGLGAEYERFSATLKTASYLKGRDNNNNAWLLGADFEIVPIDQFKVELTGFAAFNYDKEAAFNDNPVALGVSLEYQLPFNDSIILVPFAGFDFEYQTIAEENSWEAGAGVLLYTRGYDTLTSSRLLDYDDVIPVGASVAMNINENSRMNVVVSWFDPAGPDSLLPNFGGFLQFELANLLDQKDDTLGTGMDYAVLAQLEYNIGNKISPYIRLGQRPELEANGISRTKDSILKTGLGCFITPVNFFSMDLRYEMNHRQTNAGDFEVDKGSFSAVFTVRM